MEFLKKIIIEPSQNKKIENLLEQEKKSEMKTVIKPIIVYADNRALRFFEKQGFDIIPKKTNRLGYITSKILRCDRARLMEFNFN